MHVSILDNVLPTYDIALFVTTQADLETNLSKEYLKKCFELLQQYQKQDKSLKSNVHFIALNEESVPFDKFVHSPIGPLDRDYDDVRQFGDAINKAVKRALKTNARKWLLVIPSNKSKSNTLKLDKRYKHFDLVCIMESLAALYVPLELREINSSEIIPPSVLDIISFEEQLDKNILRIAQAIDHGRSVCKDIGGSDPERMPPPMVVKYIQELFQNTCIKLEIIEDQCQIERDYPLLAVVNRGTKEIEKYQARVVFLTYEPEGPYESTLGFVGKGVTYDTGGANLKVNNMMPGQQRDKCGAATVTGFFKVLADLKPKNIKVIGVLPLVRNGIGPDCYVPDEIVTSRFGLRVRIQNTDAEGRIAMADVLCHMKEKILNEKDPHLFTIATLTGHARKVVGKGYSIILPNGPALNANLHKNIQHSGAVMGDMIEISTIRREDYNFHDGPSVYEDLIQCAIKSSGVLTRGHQKPAAFMIRVTGLDKHGIDSERPIKYCHFDIAGSAGKLPEMITGAVIPSLVKQFIMPNLG